MVSRVADKTANHKPGAQKDEREARRVPKSGVDITKNEVQSVDGVCTL